MKVHACLPYSLALFTFFTTSAFAKSIYDNRFHSRDDELVQYPVKRRASVDQQPFFVGAHEEQPDMIYSDSGLQDVARVRRVEQQPVVVDRSRASLEKQLDLKRSAVEKRTDRLTKRDLKHRDEGYGIVYGNGRPIGILEPFPQSYEFSPLSSAETIDDMEPQANPRRSAVDVMYPPEAMATVPRLNNDWENSEMNLQDSAKYIDDKYPLILTDFKIQNRLNNNLVPSSFKRDSKEAGKMKMKNRNSFPTKRDTEMASSQKEAPANKVEVKAKVPSEVKRSAAGITNEKIAELKMALNRIQSPGPSDKVEDIEDNLKGILSDMGLIDGEEKENLESAKNKRSSSFLEDAPFKREINEEDENLEEGPNKIELVKGFPDAPAVDRSKREDKISVKAQTKDDNVVDLSQPKVGEQEVTNSLVKIDEDSASKASLKAESSDESADKGEVKREADEIDVTNYQSEGEAFLRSKRQEGNDIMKGNDAEMEKKRSKEFPSTPESSDKSKRQKTDKEYQQQLEENIQTKINAIKEQVKREIATLKAKDVAKERRKRDIMDTLVEGENSAVNPPDHPEEELTPHVRHRRHLVDSLQALKRIKRGLPDFSNLNNIDSGDYLDLTGEKQREQREIVNDYQVDPQESKYLPANLENLEKMNKGLVAAENALNVNDQAEAQQSKNVKIDERSVGDDSASDSNHVEEKKSVEAVESEKQEIPPQVVPEKNEAGQSEEALALQKLADETNQKEGDAGNAANSPDLGKDETGKRNVGEASEKPKPKPTETQKDDDKRNAEERSPTNNEVDLENSGLNLDLQKSKEEVNMQEGLRRRRDADDAMLRRKRADSVMPYSKSAFFPYRGEEDDGNDEGDEFEDDILDERVSLQKRETDDSPYGKIRRSADYQDYGAPDAYVAPPRPDEKRSLANRYVARMNSDVYENPTNYLYSPGTYVRKKRQNFDQLVSLHGGGPMLHHLAAVRDRNMQQLDEDSLRSKRNYKRGQNAGNEITKDEPQNIADLSDTDLFGALPQNYEGQLARFKRVKREQVASSTEKA